MTLVVLLGIAAYVTWGWPLTPQQHGAASPAGADQSTSDSPVADLAGGGTAIGFWCDTPLNEASQSDSIIAVVEGLAGRFVGRMVYRGGATLERELTEADGGYAVDDSPHGDSYRIDSGGSLVLMDAEGFIRTARRLRADARQSDCFR